MIEMVPLLHRHRLRPAAPTIVPLLHQETGFCLPLSIYTLFTFFLPRFLSLFLFVRHLSQIKRCFFSKPASPPASRSFHKGTAPRAQRQSKGGTNGCKKHGAGGEKKRYSLTSQPHIPHLPPPPGLCWWKAVKWSGSVLPSIYCLFLPRFFFFFKQRRSVTQRRCYEHKFFSRHPRMHCTSSQQKEEGRERRSVAVHRAPAPKTMSLCNIDGMHALLLKQVLWAHKAAGVFIFLPSFFLFFSHCEFSPY